MTATIFSGAATVIVLLPFAFVAVAAAFILRARRRRDRREQAGNLPLTLAALQANSQPRSRRTKQL
jgi:hypothetical protein